MLRRLSIRGLAAIESMALEFGPGLCALTGETGAGKSILIDGLGLALGRRAGAGMVRGGAARAEAAAEFAVPAGGPAASWLAERGLAERAPGGDSATAILRRGVGADGRSRAFVNDRPVTVSALAALGERLLEIHGQEARPDILDPARRRGALDAYGGLEAAAGAVARAHDARRAAAAALAEAADAARGDAAERELLQAHAGELEALAPEEGEAARLDAERRRLMAGQRVAEALAEAAAELSGDPPPERALARAAAAARKAAGAACGRLDALADALDRAVIEAAEARAGLDAAAADIDLDRDRLESVEERLFALRGVARKHRADADRLPALAGAIAARLASMDSRERGADALRAAAEAARAEYERCAARLTAGRRRAARGLAAAINGELAALRMGEARFAIDLAPLGEGAAGPNGAERVHFRASTLPGAQGGLLERVASGGELSRFMLALCVALAGKQQTPSLVFDEIDAGVGGAVAHAVGARIARLAAHAQVLVVTHHPQVAALASRHYRIVKTAVGGRAATAAERLAPRARREEIARMLSGARVTDAARAAADSLLAGAAAP